MYIKRIYVVIENWKREVDSRIYFAIKAANAGYEVFFGKKYEIYDQLKNLESGIVILKSFGPMNSKHIDEFLKNGHAVVSWDEEMFISTDLEELITRRIYLENLKKIDKLFLSGPREKELIESKYPYLKEKIFLTGHPRIDVLKKRINSIFDEDAEKIKKKHGDFILIVSSFNALNQLMVDYQIDRYFGSLLKNLDQITLDNYKKRMAFERINLEFVIKFLRIFAKKFPSKKIIIRPHPGEKINVWENICKEFDNIHCIFDHVPTNSWMKASLMSINFNCTTFFEAYLMQQKAINLFPARGFEDLEFPILNEISNKITNMEDLFKVIEFPEDYNFYKKNPNLEKYIKSFKTTECSVEQIINILKPYKNKKIKHKDNHFKLLISKIKNFLIYEIYNRYKKVIFLRKKLSDYQIFEKKMLSQKSQRRINFKDIKTKVIKLKKILNIEKKLEIKKSFNSIIKIKII